MLYVNDTSISKKLCDKLKKKKEMPDTVLFQNWEKHSPFLEHKQHITFVIFMVLSVQMPFYLYDTHFLRNLQYVNLINHIYSKFIYSYKHMVGFE